MPQQNAEATESEEAEEVLGVSSPSRIESSEDLKPGEGPFDLLSTPIAAKRSAIQCGNDSIPPIRRDHHDPTNSEQSFAERIQVVSLVAHPELGIHVERSAVASLVDEGDICWRSTGDAGGEASA